MRILVTLTILLLCSCATVHKDRSSSINNQYRIDTSSLVHQYDMETVTEEKSTASVITDADSLQTSGSMSTEDTTNYQETVETTEMRLTTSVKPKRNNKGKITGYDVKSKAVAKPKAVNVPIDRKVTRKERGLEKQQTGITDTKNETSTTSTKKSFGLNVCGPVAIVLGIVLFLIFVFRKLWK